MFLTLLIPPASIPFMLFMLSFKLLSSFSTESFFWDGHQTLGNSGRNADVIIHLSASKFRKSKEK